MTRLCLNLSTFDLFQIQFNQRNNFHKTFFTQDKTEKKQIQNETTTTDEYIALLLVRLKTSLVYLRPQPYQMFHGQ